MNPRPRGRPSGLLQTCLRAKRAAWGLPNPQPTPPRAPPPGVQSGQAWGSRPEEACPQDPPTQRRRKPQPAPIPRPKGASLGTVLPGRRCGRGPWLCPERAPVPPRVPAPQLGPSRRRVRRLSLRPLLSAAAPTDHTPDPTASGLASQRLSIRFVLNGAGTDLHLGRPGNQAASVHNTPGESAVSDCSAGPSPSRRCRVLPEPQRVRGSRGAF